MSATFAQDPENYSASRKMIISRFYEFHIMKDRFWLIKRFFNDSCLLNDTSSSFRTTPDKSFLAYFEIIANNFFSQL